jgi:putative FmdB family regulatory protein
MPIYEYQCQACHEGVEVLQKLSDAPLLECPKCGEQTMKKKVSAAAFRLKGGGWYETDFKTGNKKNLATGSESAGSGDKPASSGSGESKSGASKSNESKPSASKNTA